MAVPLAVKIIPEHHKTPEDCYLSCLKVKHIGSLVRYQHEYHVRIYKFCCRSHLIQLSWPISFFDLHAQLLNISQACSWNHIILQAIYVIQVRQESTEVHSLTYATEIEAESNDNPDSWKLCETDAWAAIRKNTHQWQKM